jgi:hypothetical protein
MRFDRLEILFLQKWHGMKIKGKDGGAIRSFMLLPLIF